MPNMTRRNPSVRNNARGTTKSAQRIGRLIEQLRLELIDIEPRTRRGFIETATDYGLPVGWISEKTLMNIEKGYNLPSLQTIHNLAVALQRDPIELFTQIEAILSSEDDAVPAE